MLRVILPTKGESDGAPLRVRAFEQVIAPQQKLIIIV